MSTWQKSEFSWFDDPERIDAEANESTARPAPAGKADDEQFEVERIVDRRMADLDSVEGATWEYLVKWKGYSATDNTWEPDLSLLADVPEMVSAFVAEQQRKQQVAARSQSSSKATTTSSAASSSKVVAHNTTETPPDVEFLADLKRQERQKAPPTSAPEKVRHEASSTSSSKEIRGGASTASKKHEVPRGAPKSAEKNGACSKTTHQNDVELLERLLRHEKVASSDSSSDDNLWTTNRDDLERNAISKRTRSTALTSNAGKRCRHVSPPTTDSSKAVKSFNSDGHRLGTQEEHDERIKARRLEQQRAASSSHSFGLAAPQVAGQRRTEAAESQLQEEWSVGPTSFKQLHNEVMREMSCSLRVQDVEPREKAATPTNKVIDETPLLAVEGVSFKCPAIGPGVFKKEELLGKIREYLDAQYEIAPGPTACVMVVTLNPTQPADKLAACKQALVRCLDNIVCNQGVEKYLQLRYNNDALQQRVLSFEGGEKFLYAAGFEKRAVTSHDAEGNETTEDYLVLPSDRVDVPHLESLRDLLPCAEPIVPKLDRGTRILRPTGRHRPDEVHLPDSFFARSSAELKAEYEQRRRNLEDSRQLRTKEMREREQQREKRRYRYTLLRIRFPSTASSSSGEQLIVQATFGAHETVQALIDYLRDDVLSDACRSCAWALYEPAERRTIQTDSAASEQAKELLDSRLYDVNLVPAAIVAFKPPTDSKGIGNYLKRELLARAQEL